MKPRRFLPTFILVLLLIEFADELIGGVREAAWPMIRADLGLTYTQIGLLLSLPGILGSLIEPVLGILADAGKRRNLILTGGVVFVASCFLAAASASFLPLLLAYTVFFPASGAFVGLSQTVLMDLQPDRHEQNMTRWTFAGSFGYVIGPLLIGASAVLGLGWRTPFLAVASLAALVLGVSLRAFQRNNATAPDKDVPGSTLIQGLRSAVTALRRVEVLRWLVLLEFSDLMLDVFYSYLALYLVAVSGLSPASAALGVGIWTGVGLLGDFLIIPLLERIPGLVYLRISALLKLLLFPVFLLTPWVPLKFTILGLLGFLNAGWYSVLQGQLYTAMPGKSGTVMSLGSLAGIAGKLLPLALGLFAQRFGLGAAMWLLLLGPTALLVGLPLSAKRQKRHHLN
jgi:FSR family fosmidomycin resistance protein-like MFS transporter